MKYLIIILVVVVGFNIGCSLKSDFKDQNIIKDFKTAQDAYYTQNRVYADSFKKLGFTFVGGESMTDCEYDKKYQDCMGDMPSWPAVMIKRIVYLDISDPREGYAIIVNHGCDRYRYTGAQTKTDFKISKLRF